FENDDDNDGIKEKSFTIFKEFNANSNYSNHWYRCADNDADKHKIFDPFKKHDDVSNSKISLLIDNKEKLVDIDQIIPIVNNKEQWVTWGLDNGSSKKIQWPYPDQYVTPIRHACKALEYLNFKKDLLVSYKKQRGFEEMYEYIVKIILKFIRDKPEIWRLMDTRYEVMSNLINGGVNSLIKYILFGKDQIGDNNKELASNSIGINSKLKEDTESNLLQSSVEKIPCFKKNAFGNQNRASPNLCVVPLPNFTVNKIEKKNVQKNVVITCLRRLILPHKYID
ncbi:15328_t:CDS:2, partial [Entrophospora sp. SA101]